MTEEDWYKEQRMERQARKEIKVWFEVDRIASAYMGECKEIQARIMILLCNELIHDMELAAKIRQACGYE